MEESGEEEPLEVAMSSGGVEELGMFVSCRERDCAMRSRCML